MRRLPFLNGVRAFEAAARGGSFARAAEELRVSPAAVSRLVRLLEQRLGIALFERGANRLALTAAGRAYQAGLTRILDALADLTDQVTAAARRQVLTVGVGPTFAIRWLIPRLAGFRALAPEIDVRITSGGQATPFDPDWSCGITLGDGDWPGLVAEPLFAADLLPVCAPALAPALATPGDLDAATLLRVAHAPDDWPRWLRAAGLPGVTAAGPELEYYGQALQAAIDGVGIAMGIRPYVDDDLAAGRLVAPFGITVSKGKRWYLVHRLARAEEPAFAAFRAWLTERAALTPSATPSAGTAAARPAPAR